MSYDVTWGKFSHIGDRYKREEMERRQRSMCDTMRQVREERKKKRKKFVGCGWDNFRKQFKNK